MKRKTIVLLSSIMASTLLVGGAFAAFAVTDNADPFGINVTPGDLDVDDTTYVTLKWGDSTGLTGIGNLKVGENRKAGIVSLKATPAYEGVFTLTLEDQTTASKETTDAKLLDYLNVYVYAGNLNLGENDVLPEATPTKSIVKATEKDSEGKKTLTFNAQGTPAGAEYSIFVNLDSSANPVFPQMQSDKVHIEVDWSPKSGELATGKVIYTALPSGWDSVYAYAWNGEKTNAAWPGVQMVHAYDNVYQISVPTDTMDKVIFNDNDGHQTEDLAFTGYDANTAPYWNGTAWAAKPEKAETVDVVCTVNGVAQELVDKIEQSDTQNNHVYELTLAKDAVVVFKEGLSTLTFAGGANEYTATGAGKHTFYLSKDGFTYVVYNDAPATAYYVVGTIGGENKWNSTEIALVANPGQEGEYMTAEPIHLLAGDGIKVKDSTSYYPDGDGNEYQVTKEGDYNVYFRPAGNTAWDPVHYFGVVEAE